MVKVLLEIGYCCKDWIFFLVIFIIRSWGFGFFIDCKCIIKLNIVSFSGWNIFKYLKNSKLRIVKLERVIIGIGILRELIFLLMYC